MGRTKKSIGMQPAQSKTMQLLGSSFLISLIVCLAVVIIFNSRAGSFHGYLPTMSKVAIMSLRTALAGLSIFTFFPLIWTMHRRSDEQNPSRVVSWSILALVLAETPTLFGLVLFLMKGAFRTFFAFFVLSAVYMLVVWPRESS